MSTPLCLVRISQKDAIGFGIAKDRQIKCSNKTNKSKYIYSGEIRIVSWIKISLFGEPLRISYRKTPVRLQNKLLDDELISSLPKVQAVLPPDPLHYPTSVLARKKKGIAPPKHPFQYNGILAQQEIKMGCDGSLGGKGMLITHWLFSRKSKKGRGGKVPRFSMCGA